MTYSFGVRVKKGWKTPVFWLSNPLAVVRGWKAPGIWKGIILQDHCDVVWREANPLLMNVRSRVMLDWCGWVIVDFLSVWWFEGHHKVRIPASHWHLSKKRDVSFFLPSPKALSGAIDLVMAEDRTRRKVLEHLLIKNPSRPALSFDGSSVSCGPFAKLCGAGIVEMKSCL